MARFTVIPRPPSIFREADGLAHLQVEGVDAGIKIAKDRKRKVIYAQLSGKDFLLTLVFIFFIVITIPGVNARDYLVQQYEKFAPAVQKYARQLKDKNRWRP